ncbi:BnaC07g33380D [Brassica napus]|uniref:BnaC07g33380D protein n=1 Tax=Brassica napus TaxID=3708 RepID=A0A078FCF5_BRANA|nr:BnaC07g33380D [Brassica napus]
MAQNDRNTRIAQKAFEMVDKVYGNTTSCRRVIYQYSNGSTIKEPVVPHPTERIQYFGGATARPFIGHTNRFERPKGRAINCDEAVQLYGGVLIKEFHQHMLKLVVKAFT